MSLPDVVERALGRKRKKDCCGKEYLYKIDFAWLSSVDGVFFKDCYVRESQLRSERYSL